MLPPTQYDSDKNRFFTAFLLLLGIFLFMAWNKLEDNAKEIERTMIENELKSAKHASAPDPPEPPTPAPSGPPQKQPEAEPSPPRMTRRRSTRVLLKTPTK
jgi:type IV secretory pathway VirB10-like protein